MDQQANRVKALVPAARAFKPDQGFAAIARVVVNLASELCQGRVVSVLEGGYRLDGLADSVAAHVRVLQGR